MGKRSVPNRTVGRRNSSTPNTTYEANKWVNAHKGSHDWNAGEGASSPLQLTNCPWCGTRLGPDNLKVETYKAGRGRTFLHCKTQGLRLQRAELGRRASRS